MKTKLNRWQAFGIHLAISIAIFLILLAVIIFYWYPGIFINAGGWQGIKIVAGIDIILGPMLTLIVFNPIKKELSRDLTIIAVLQFSSLSVGTWLISQERPLLQVMAEKSMYIITHADLKLFDIDPAFADKIPGPYPKAVFLELPEDSAQISKLEFNSAYIDELPLVYRHDLYRPLTKKSADQLKWRLGKLNYNEQLQCWEIPVISNHFRGNSCASLKLGLVSLN